MNRYKDTQKIINNSESYKDLFIQKNIKNILQYSTFTFKDLSKGLDDISFTYHKVEPFDTLYNISNKYYGSPEYGWLICYTNGLKSELELEQNFLLKIYFPIKELIGLL